jgi:hypothetical protein
MRHWFWGYRRAPVHARTVCLGLLLATLDVMQVCLRIVSWAVGLFLKVVELFLGGVMPEDIVL